MNIISKSVLFVLGIAALSSMYASAEPYLAVKTGNKCSACHVNPIGGGARNDFGAYYGAQVLARTVSSVENFDPGKINSTIRLGGDLRFNYDQSDGDDSDNDSQSFNTQSSQIYIAVQPKDSNFLFYLDQQVAPGSALSREAFVLTKFGQHYLKVGKMMLPYGLRLEDDSAFVRQASGMNFDNSDNGVELGLEYTKGSVNFAMSNGSTGTSNDDEQFQYAIRGEYIDKHWRIGAGAVLNDAELGQRRMANIFGGFYWGPISMLAELDHIEDESVSNVDGENEVIIAGLVELNAELSKGYNLKVTSEFLDPDDNIEENERARHSLLLEYTPYSYFQVRGGVRSGDDIPQREQGNFTDFFLQAHMYF